MHIVEEEQQKLVSRLDQKHKVCSFRSVMDARMSYEHKHKHQCSLFVQMKESLEDMLEIFMNLLDTHRLDVDVSIGGKESPKKKRGCPPKSPLPLPEERTPVVTKKRGRPPKSPLPEEDTPCNPCTESMTTNNNIDVQQREPLFSSTWDSIRYAWSLWKSAYTWMTIDQAQPNWDRDIYLSWSKRLQQLDVMGKLSPLRGMNASSKKSFLRSHEALDGHILNEIEETEGELKRNEENNVI